MATQEIKTTLQNNIYFHFLPTKKYKTNHIIVKLKAPLARDTVTKRALISYMLKQGTVSYPSEQAIMQKLDALYGATLRLDTMKRGSNHIIHIQLEVANERFIQGESAIINEALQLLQEIIFSPVTENGVFPETVVATEKRKLTNKINALKDNKLLYANQRLINHMYENEPFSLHKDGYISDLDTIDATNLYAYYETMLNNDQIDIYVVGDFLITEMEQLLSTHFARKKWNRVEEQSIPAPQLIEQREQRIVTEHEAIQQAKLHIGYRTNCTIADATYGALQVFNGIFGGYPSSRLFINVREKNSLAYYIASRIESHQGLLIVYSGIEAADVEKTIAIINEQYEAICAGDFTESELQETKQLIISNLYETLDQPTNTVELFYQYNLANKSLTIKEMIAQIEQVTKEAVCDIANNIQLDTIYLLANEEGGAS